MKGRASISTDAKRALRHAVEIRHAGFATPEFVKMLRDYDVALVCADTVEWPRLMDVTSDFTYCRLLGSGVPYASGYDDKSLDLWAKRVAIWAKGAEPADAERVIQRAGPERKARDVFIYFDNDVKVNAPIDARNSMKRTEKLLKA